MWDLEHLQRSDVRFGVIWCPPVCRCFCKVGVGFGASARGLMYVLASFGFRDSVTAFAWQAWDLENLQWV